MPDFDNSFLDDAPCWPQPAVIRLALVGVLSLLLGLSPLPRAALAAAAKADAATAAGEYDAALDDLAAARAYLPGEDALTAREAEAALQAGHYSLAAADLEALAAQRPLTADEMLWLAEAYDGAGQHDRALSAWEAARAQGVESAAGLESLARHYLEEGQRGLARVTLEDLARLGLDDPALLTELGLLQALDAPDAAVYTLQQAVVLDPATAEHVAPLIEALTAAPGDLPEYRDARLGVAALDVGEIELAREALERAVARNSAYGEALAYLAYVRLLVGEPARAAAEQAAALAPDDATVQSLRGQVWLRTGEPGRALPAFERAYALAPGNPALAVQVASAHRAADEPALAEMWLQEAVARAGGAYAYRLALAQFYVDDEYEVAAEGLPLALDLVAGQPEDAAAHATLAQAHFLTGDVSAAFIEADRALALDDGSARAHAVLAILLDSQGRWSEAVPHYRRAAELDPEGRFGALARRALERIEG